jgi:hypothetical protein
MRLNMGCLGLDLQTRDGTTKDPGWHDKARAFIRKSGDFIQPASRRLALRPRARFPR